MPLVAKHKDTGERIDITTIAIPKAVLKSGDCLCQLCGEALIIKSEYVRMGYPVQAHFAHRSQCDSRYDAHPESAEHLAGKRHVKQMLEQFYGQYARVAIDYEVPVPMEWRAKGRQADLMVTWPMGWREAHEIQLASITVEQLEERTNDYAKAGIDAVWYLGKRALTESNWQWCANRGIGHKLYFEMQDVDQ